MNEDEYIELRKKEMHLVMIKVAEKDKVEAFNVLLNSPFPMTGFSNEEYRVSELALRILDKKGIEYWVLK